MPPLAVSPPLWTGGRSVLCISAPDTARRFRHKIQATHDRIYYKTQHDVAILGFETNWQVPCNPSDQSIMAAPILSLVII